MLDGVDIGDEVTVTGAEARHAVKVRRLRAGEGVELADGAGTRVSGVVRRVVTDAGRAGPEMVVEVERRVVEPEPSPRFVLVQALAKGERDLAAVETATELGVDEVVPWQAARSVVVWRGDRTATSHRRWVATAVAAAKQSRRARVPGIGPLVTTAELCERVGTAAVAFALHEAAARSLADVPLPAQGDVLVVVGPEGGLADEELAALEGAGALVVRLGATVLRSSSAGPAALAVLSARSRWT